MRLLGGAFLRQSVTLQFDIETVAEHRLQAVEQAAAAARLPFLDQRD